MVNIQQNTGKTFHSSMLSQFYPPNFSLLKLCLHFRMFIWRSLLQLPENHTAFSSLIDKGVHVAFLNLQKKYPIKSRKLLRVLQRYVQCIAATCLSPKILILYKWENREFYSRETQQIPP